MISEYDISFTATFAPEISFVLCLPFKEARGWFFRMIEDSDGDPHHTDGLFLILLFAALWSFRIAIIAGLKIIYFDKDLLQVSITFLSTGCGLLGIRIALKSKLLSPANETKNE